MHARRKVLLLAALGAVLPGFALAQAKVTRIGILSARSRSTASNPDPFFDAFVRGMSELGYVDGKNLVIEWRFADGKFDRLPGLASELVKAKVEVIVTHSTPTTLALQRATSTIPIVMTAVINPVDSGLVKSLGRPGGNITGMSLRSDDVSPKHIELLQTLLPGLSRVGVLVNPGTAVHPRLLKNIRAVAQSKGVNIVAAEAGSLEEIARGFEKMALDGAQAVLVPPDAFYFFQRRQIAEIAVRHRMPTILGDREFVKAGGLISYGTDAADSYRRAATYVDRIVKGAKPGELAIELPTKYDLVINRKTARALGLSIPSELLVRADEVIE